MIDTALKKEIILVAFKGILAFIISLSDLVKSCRNELGHMVVGLGRFRHWNITYMYSVAHFCYDNAQHLNLDGLSLKIL